MNANRASDVEAKAFRYISQNEHSSAVCWQAEWDGIYFYYILYNYLLDVVIFSHPLCRIVVFVFTTPLPLAEILKHDCDLL